MSNMPEEHPDKASHPLAKGLGAVGGGVAGAAVGRSIAGKLGATVGGIVGALAGGMAGDALAEVTSEVVEDVQPSYSLGLGANNLPVEVPRHYSWEELQALSKPQ